MSIPKVVLKPPFSITRASHAVLRVKDLSASKAFYVDSLGMAISDEDSRTVYLRGLEEACHHSIVLKVGAEPHCERIGMRVLCDEDLELAQRHFDSIGLPTKWVDTPFQGRTLHTVDPVGTPLEFCATMELRPRLIKNFELCRGACVQRLDHTQVLTPEVKTARDFYMSLGFRLSEYISTDESGTPALVFLQRKGNPHDIVFANGDGPRLHHVAFMIPEVHHLLHACDLLGRNGFGKGVEFGPQRHYSPGYARFVYARDPDGHRVELFNTHYQTMDIEDEPVEWTVSDLNEPNAWGPPPPQRWFNEASTFVDTPVVEPRIRSLSPEKLRPPTNARQSSS